MERIKVKTVTKAFDNSDMLGHAILESIGCDKAGDAVFKGMKGKGENKYMEVEFKINGVEVHFSHFVYHIDKELDHVIKLTAKQLVDTELEGLDDKISTLTRAIKHNVHKTVKDKLGLDIKDEDYY